MLCQAPLHPCMHGEGSGSSICKSGRTGTSGAAGGPRPAALLLAHGKKALVGWLPQVPPKPLGMAPAALSLQRAASVAL